MRIHTFALALLTPLIFAISATAQTPHSYSKPPVYQDSVEKKDERMHWFRDARFGMFIHWGLYSQLGGEWRDKHVNGGAEWIQEYLQIPTSQYSPLKKTFDGSDFNADAWVKAIANAGIKYICVTTKHHDGFCMWPTKLNDDWNITVTPFKRDPMKELSDACKRHGVTFCIYHSILDWHHADWPMRPPYNDFATGKPDKEKYRNYLYGQLEELFTHYGPIGMIWLDGSWHRSVWTSEDGKQLEDFIRKLQPSVVINNRSGYLPPQPKLKIKFENDYGYTFAGDYISPEGEVPSTGLPGIDWETCQTMQLPNNWGYNRLVGFRTYTDLLRQMVDVASKGGNLLLNIGPTGAGEITPQALGCLEKFGVWMRTNGEAIHGTSASPIEHLPFEGRCTRKDNRLYLHVFNWPNADTILCPTANRVKRAWLLGSPDQPLATRSSGRGTIIEIPKSAPDSVVSVIAVELDGAPQPQKSPEVISKGLKAEVSSFWPGREAELSPTHITDGNLNTIWAAEEKARTATVTLDLGSEREICEVFLSDAPYGRTTQFVLEVRDGKNWKKVSSGGGIGPSLQIPLEAVKTSAVRIRILDATDTPTLAEFQISVIQP